MISYSWKLEQQLSEWYRQAHTKNCFAGRTWQECYDKFTVFLPTASNELILDFGCGPKGGLKEMLADRVIPYDPYVNQYLEEPWSKPFTALFSCDVFEHIPSWQLPILINRIAQRESLKHIFLCISTRQATKVFPNGLNMHLTIRSADWWFGLLYGIVSSRFSFELIETDVLLDKCFFGLRRIGQ